MTPIALPPFHMISGQPFSVSMLFRSEVDGPVDLTQAVHGVAWSGRAAFTRDTPGREPAVLLEVPLALKSSGRVLLNLSVEGVARLTGPHVACQINLNAPHPDFNEVWRAAVIVQ